uniref:Putative methyltransferase n=2 Tax=viral metagenome TaxID=1070528 RepID=A0A6H1ZG91_9ZZZZ
MAREQWVEELPKGIVCAEIGVQRGKFARRIFDAVQPQVLYLVDCWRTIYKQEGDVVPYVNAHYQKLQLYITVKRFRNEILSGRVRPLIAFSKEAASLMQDGHLDFVYIDAFHAYEDCYEDITLWAPKVKSGGIVAGHDYHKNGPFGECGVPRAVDQYVAEHGLSLNLVEDNPMRVHGRVWESQTWWFKKP